MTPEQWERMSWHQRQAFLRTIGDRERWVRREMARLSGLRNQVAHLIPEAFAAPDPAQTLEEARRIHAALPPEDPRDIHQRQQQLINGG